MRYSVRYNLSTNRGSPISKPAHIRLRLSWAGQRLEMSTGIRIAPSHWQTALQRAKPSYFDRHTLTSGTDINSELAEIEAFVASIFRKHTEQRTSPTHAALRRELSRYLSGELDGSHHDIYHYIDIFVSTMSRRNTWSTATVSKFRQLTDHLRSWNARCTLDDLDEEGLQSFLQHLFDTGLRNTTAAKTIAMLRWFLRWAHQHGHTDRTDYETFRPHLRGTDGNSHTIVYLDWHELMDIYHHDFGTAHADLAATRDIFCLGCFTGLRYSDLSTLRKADIHADHISVVTHKTADGLHIELNDYSRAILDRYKDYRHPRNLALPIPSNAAMNRQLKEIGLLCCVTAPVRTVHYVRDQRIEQEQPKWKLLTTHCARRTFVVHALRLGIPAEVIMKWTGHSGYSSMKPYVAIVDELKAQQMRKFNVPPPDLPPEIDHATLRQDVPNPQPLQTDERLGSGNPDTH